MTSLDRVADKHPHSLVASMTSIILITFSFISLPRPHTHTLHPAPPKFKSVCDGVKAESARIVIESDEISLDPTCGAFITMNPGYLGRSELPEGLKALFRPITVMVPDLVLICENMLMAEGFTQAKVLASKFYGLYSLLRDLLSKQLHYDW